VIICDGIERRDGEQDEEDEELYIAIVKVLLAAGTLVSI